VCEKERDRQRAIQSLNVRLCMWCVRACCVCVRYACMCVCVCARARAYVHVYLSACCYFEYAHAHAHQLCMQADLGHIHDRFLCARDMTV